MGKMYDVFIENERATVTERLPSINPYTREEWASIPQASPVQVADAIAAACQAYETVWSKISGKDRARSLHRLAMNSCKPRTS